MPLRIMLTQLFVLSLILKMFFNSKRVILTAKRFAYKILSVELSY